MINIIKKTYSINGTLKKRSKTEECIIHHAAAKKSSVEDIDRWHKERDFACIGYHLVVRKDGSIYEGRPIDKVGAHATNHNSKSIGICFEGNFEIEEMNDVQKQAGIKACQYVKSLYPDIKFLKHKDVGNTACPGKNFPFSEIVNGIVENVPRETKSILELANEVIAGKWGNGDERKQRLGSLYNEVQTKVNELLKGNKPSVEYYPKCSSNHISIVNALNSIGVDSSYSFRKKIAQKNNVHDYIGSYSQNVSLLSKLKAGRLIKV